MASKTKKRAPKKASARKSAKTAARTAAKKSARKKKSAAQKPAGKAAKPKPARQGPLPLADDETALDLDEILEVDDLLEDVDDGEPDEPEPARSGPRTPTVPRSVKPAPKIADIDLDPEVLAFIDAVDKYKHEYSRPFPSWTEVFFILRRLGYHKVAD